MENTHSVQQQASQVETQVETPTPKPKKMKSKPAASKNSLVSLVHLFVRYPLLMPIGLSAVFLGSSTVAVYTLGYVGYVEPEDPEVLEAEVVKPINTSSEPATPMPTWMLMSIALSCGGGTLALFLLLNRPSQRQKVKSHFDRYHTRLTQRQSRIESRPPRRKPVFVPAKVRVPAMAMSPQTQPVVTVLPPEHSGSRHSSHELASVFDIRKHTPLSAILRKD